MSEALKEKVSEEYQGPVKTYVLFDQNDIQITLSLPGNLQFNQNSQELYPPLSSQSPSVAPVLVNNSKFDIESATFIVTLQDVLDRNTIANVLWWNLEEADGQAIMEFTCGPVSKKLPNSEAESVTSKPTEKGYSRIRWATMSNNGKGQSNFLIDVSSVKLVIGPVSADPKKPVIGPTVLIG